MPAQRPSSHSIRPEGHHGDDDAAAAAVVAHEPSPPTQLPSEHRRGRATGQPGSGGQSRGATAQLPSAQRWPQDAASLAAVPDPVATAAAAHPTTVAQLGAAPPVATAAHWSSRAVAACVLSVLSALLSALLLLLLLPLPPPLLLSLPAHCRIVQLSECCTHSSLSSQ